MLLQLSGLCTGMAFDNYDELTETLSGKDTLHDTVGISFQNKPTCDIQQGRADATEMTVDAPRKRPMQDEKTEMPLKRRRRKFDPPVQTIEPYKRRPSMQAFSYDVYQVDAPENTQMIQRINQVWMLSCFLRNDTPMWHGWNSRIYHDHLPEQSIGYMENIALPPTRLDVVRETLCIAQKVARECGEQYAIVHYDLAIAKPAIQIQMQEAPRFDDVFVCFGTFHIMLAYFGSLGYILESSGGPEVLCGVDVLGTGSVKGFLSGKHYNRCKRLHPILATALHILHFRHFILLHGDVSEEMKELVNVFAENPSQENLIKLLQSDTCTALLDRYDQFTECTRRGEHGKTAMFWLSYIDFVHIYLLLDYAVHTNDVDLYIHALGLMCPVFFATHRPNYARWMTKFHLNLMNMENTHKGVRAIFEGGALSIRRTGKNFARSAVDLTLEQTVNKDAASRQGGITAFTQCVEARKRWTLTRAFRGAVVSSLLEMVGLSHGETTSQDLKPYRIRRDNRDLRSVLISLEETMNPFQENLPDLYCLATGRAASAEVQEDLTSIIAKGREWHQEFTEECRADPKRFEKPIKRRKVKNFTKDVLCGKIVGKDKKLKEIRYTRDIFGRLLYLAISMELDLAEVLAYPLTEVPLSLCHLSGAMNKTDKSALMRKLEAKGTENSEPTEIDAYILDTMFFLRTLPELPPTFGGIATLILQNACTYAHTVHIVCDTYKDGASIKEHERQERGNYEARFQITGPSQRRPANFHQALLSASFKTALLQFLKDEWMSISYAKMLEGHDVYFALEGCCYLYTCQDGAVNVQEVRELRSEHEEADTRIIFHADYIMKQSEIPPTVAIRSCDTDVFILLLYHQNHINSKFWMDTGTSSKNTRRMINIAELAQMVTPQVCCALPAFHAFTGCDYTGSFLRKAKAKPYDRMIKNPKYLSAFSDLGNSESVCTKTEAVIEEFVCRMYGVQVEKDVNRTRFHLFKKLYAPKNLENPLNIIKSTDPCCLPPCKDVLRQKLKRTNYVAHLWKGARKAKPIAYSPEGSGWRNTDTKHLEIVWFQGPRSPSKLSAAVAEDPSFNDEDEDDDDDDENLTYSISSDEEDDDDSDYE